MEKVTFPISPYRSIGFVWNWRKHFLINRNNTDWKWDFRLIMSKTRLAEKDKRKQKWRIWKPYHHESHVLIVRTQRLLCLRINVAVAARRRRASGGGSERVGDACDWSTRHPGGGRRNSWCVERGRRSSARNVFVADFGVVVFKLVVVRLWTSVFYLLISVYPVYPECARVRPKWEQTLHPQSAQQTQKQQNPTHNLRNNTI